VSLRLGRALVPYRALVGSWIAPSLIQSIQTAVVASNNTAISYTATITAVDVSRTLLIPLGVVNGGTDGGLDKARLELTNSTTVTLTFGSATNNPISFSFVVVELAPGLLRSLQYGTVTITAAATTGTATIVEVNVTKAFLIYLGNTFSIAGVLPGTYYQSNVILTNATTVTSNRQSAAAGGTNTAGFVVVELF
jgi:hypothetical protein